MLRLRPLLLQLLVNQLLFLASGPFLSHGPTARSIMMIRNCDIHRLRPGLDTLSFVLEPDLDRPGAHVCQFRESNPLLCRGKVGSLKGCVQDRELFRVRALTFGLDPVLTRNKTIFILVSFSLSSGDDAVRVSLGTGIAWEN